MPSRDQQGRRKIYCWQKFGSEYESAILRARYWRPTQRRPQLQRSSPSMHLQRLLLGSSVRQQLLISIGSCLTPKPVFIPDIKATTQWNGKIIPSPEQSLPSNPALLRPHSLSDRILSWGLFWSGICFYTQHPRHVERVLYILWNLKQMRIPWIRCSVACSAGNNCNRWVKSIDYNIWYTCIYIRSDRPIYSYV